MMHHREGVVVTATELKQNFGKYMEYVLGQNDVVITKNGKKTARLTPYVTDIEQYFTVREKALDYQYGGKKVSYQEFMEIYEKSTLRMEFINGEIYLLDSPTAGHQQILGRLYLLLNDYFQDKECQVFLAPFDIHFSKKGFKDPDVMQPDISVACDVKENITDRGRYMGTPDLVVEILSDSTRTKDMVDKLNTYVLSGVKEYWIVDQKQEQVMVYAFSENEIDFCKTYGKGSIAQSLAFTGLSVDTGDIFRNLLSAGGRGG